MGVKALGVREKLLNALTPQRLNALLLFLLLAGCSPGKKEVSVDVDRLLREGASPAAPQPTPPSPPSADGSFVLEQPGMPARALRRVAGGARDSQVRREIEAIQTRARKSLEARLRRAYALEARRFEIEAEREEERGRLATYEKVSARVREAFEAAADKRAPRLAHLTILAGFPDTKLKEPPPPEKKVSRMRYDEAQRLRKELAEIEAAYQAQVAEILRSVEDDLAEGALALRVRIENLRAAADRRAAEQAAAQVQITTKDLGIRLAPAPNIELPAVPPQRVVVEPGAPLSPAPEVRSQGVLAGPGDRRRLLEHELGIWLGLRRYALAKDGQDATEEFKEWRARHEAGR